ncbi:MAG: hypothetical protein R2772_05030 [Chitinophagales bacterium]
MIFKVAITTIFECSLERAFKTPMLCDLSKVHTGLIFMPKVTHTTEDENWGKVGSSKKVQTAKSFWQKGGFASMDHVLERKENLYWKIQVDSFQSWILGFSKFVGEWETKELAANKIQVIYSYSLHAKQPLLYPFNYLFVHLFWKNYMHQVLENVRQMAYSQESYLFD